LKTLSTSDSLRIVQHAPQQTTPESRPDPPELAGQLEALRPFDDEAVRETMVLLESRRAQMDGQLWDSPALLVAAQAFLFAAALSGGTPRFARAVILLVGMVPLVVAWQTMAKKVYLERAYSEALAACRHRLRLPEVRRDEGRYPTTVLRQPGHMKARWYSMFVVDRKSQRLWMTVFFAFLVADVLLLTNTLAHP
jgi:hypothetical protein